MGLLTASKTKAGLDVVTLCVDSIIYVFLLTANGVKSSRLLGLRQITLLSQKKVQLMLLYW
jgi:hypothetical protein